MGEDYRPDYGLVVAMLTALEAGDDGAWESLRKDAIGTTNAAQATVGAVVLLARLLVEALAKERGMEVADLIRHIGLRIAEDGQLGDDDGPPGPEE